MWCTSAWPRLGCRTPAGGSVRGVVGKCAVRENGWAIPERQRGSWQEAVLDLPDVELSAAVEAYLRATPQIDRERKHDRAEVDMVAFGKKGTSLPVDLDARLAMEASSSRVCSRYAVRQRQLLTIEARTTRNSQISAVTPTYISRKS